MPGPPPEVPIALKAEERRELEAIVRKATSPQRDVLRARIVLLAAEGAANEAIARTVGCAPNTVRTWRRRFAAKGVEGLKDRPRSGRPPVYGDRDRAVVVAIACELPAQRGLPLSRLSLNDVHREAERELRPCPSVSTIRRWLREDAIRPWSHRNWVFPRDPHFLEKASRVLDLYHGMWAGKPLGEKDVVVCADEKRIQMVRREVPTAPPSPGQPMKVEHEYERLGVIAYHAVLDVRTGKVAGRCAARSRAVDFQATVDAVMAEAPCQSAERVFWIVDNGPAHTPRSFPMWLEEHHPKAVAVHLPVHASWLNQAEAYFSALQRKALTPMDVRDGDALVERLRDFEDRYNERARPYEWKFTRRDLRNVLRRLDGKG
jgi:hypothetical protein